MKPKTKIVSFGEVREGGTLSATKRWVPATKRGNRANIIGSSSGYVLEPHNPVYVELTTEDAPQPNNTQQ